MLKTTLLLTPLALGGAWATGVFDAGTYSREVDRPPTAVLAALEDVDIRQQPGAPGTDPARSGGTPPLFRTERTADSIIVTVMSGDKVATKMTVRVTPLADGSKSRVTTSVERGDAPDDFVSPALRSESLTLALLSASVEDELNELVAPPRADPATCEALQLRLLAEAAPAAARAETAENPLQAIGATSRIALHLHAAEAELRRNGCPTTFNGEFAAGLNAPTEGLKPAPQTVEGVSFVPGKPMIVPKPSR